MKFESVLFLALIIFCSSARMKSRTKISCRAYGEDCDSNWPTHYCCEGLKCDEYRCLQEDTKRCDWVVHCPDGFYCDKNRCLKAPDSTDVSVPCDVARPCKSGFECFDYRCQKKADDTCDWIHHCGDGFHCFKNRCVEDVADACDPGHFCPEGFHCFDYRCRKDGTDNGALGDVCDAFHWCGDGLKCEKHRCVKDTEKSQSAIKTKKTTQGNTTTNTVSTPVGDINVRYTS